MKFTVKNRVLSCVDQEVPIADNADYVAEFEVDEEWMGKMITARFICDNGYAEKILNKEMKCNIPMSALCGIVKVGLYVGDIMATTVAIFSTRNSIKTGSGATAAPSEDVYAQLLEMIGGIENGSY